jgi:NAD(P)-dependent dehydrogenase (short-subunit alcohol dehydrogenase family)
MELDGKLTTLSTSQEDHGATMRGRTVVVTGASSGIGGAAARRLAREGGRVVLVGRDVDRLEDCRADVRRSGGDCHTVPVDLAADDASAVIVREAVGAFGGIDVLVHAAGVFRVDPFASQGPDELDRQFRVNVRAPYALTHAALEHLRPGASVVFVSSNLAQVGMSGAAAYCGTKGAVDALARALAVELAPQGIRVNTVAPGIVRTPMTQRLAEDPAAEASAIALTPAGRLGEVEDIAAAIAYVTSDDARYMVGSTMVVDGGWNAQ